MENIKMKLFIITGLSFLLFLAFSVDTKNEQSSIDDHDLVFTELAKTWDEGIPLGNGTIGVLIWKKENKLRFSLDRADLWDLRPMDNLNTSEWSFEWVYQQWKNNNYKAVQKNFDMPYDKSPAPSKIPAGALEFNIENFGEIESVRLILDDAVCKVKWKNGVLLTTFVHASKSNGWYRFDGLENLDLSPQMIMPDYALKGEDAKTINSLKGQDLRRLGYKEGTILKGENEITFDQKGWNEFNYQIHTKWKTWKNSLEGTWSISSNKSLQEHNISAKETVNKIFKAEMQKELVSHKEWWQNFWNRSSISIPDQVLEKQWYLEMYKFGSAARADAPPISLQSVWTADNGKLPPWKGDFHHDLNTQLSYWPSYSANHLDLEQGFINWLVQYKPTFKKYTKAYFKTDGLNVPGVTTLTGEPMGGWIQYSFGPTVGAWLGQHFYLHWRYSMDRDFLKEHAYPWIKDVAIYLDQISERSAEGKRKLPISSSPEIFDNSKKAWFSQTTNFDLAFIRWTYEKASELALELGKEEEAQNWQNILSEWPSLWVDGSTGLVFAPGTPYTESHRHFSHLVGFHPLGIIDRSNGAEHQKIIENTLDNLLNIGSDWFTGYSFSWLGNLQARNFDGEGAAKSLRIFSENFCLPNSFHVNGEQHNRGYSKFKYRPFTLEGNFAFASGIQEMLIQSHTGIVILFPAIPKSWKTISFNQLRTEGAFLFSAKKKDGLLKEVKITSEKGGILKLKNPFEENKKFSINTKYTTEGDIFIIPTSVGQHIVLTQ